MSAAAQIEQARELARQAATAHAEVQSATVHQLPVTNNTNTAVTVPGKALSMETIGGGSLSVDAWVKVNEDGLKIGDSALISSLVVSMEMTDGRGFMVKKSIKAGKTPVQYFSTYDGVTAVSGGSWETAVARALAIDPTAREYRCVDLPFRLEEVAVDIKGKEVAKPGTMLGYSTSTTNWANWEKFYKEVVAAGLMGQEVMVKLTAQERTNKSMQKWGVIVFELLGEVAEGGE